MSLRGGTTKQSHSYSYLREREEIATLSLAMTYSISFATTPHFTFQSAHLKSAHPHICLLSYLPNNLL